MSRHLTCLFLVLLLVLTSQSMAVARGAAPVAGQMVLCIGGGTVAVYVDAQGQPTDAPRLCPEATLTLLSATPPVVAAVPYRLVQFVMTPGVLPVPVPVLHHLPPPARAPPLEV